MGHWLPEHAGEGHVSELPDLSDAALLASLDQWLGPVFAGKTRLDALDESELANALHAKLDWNLRQQLERMAPVRITVPSGMERRIDYALDADGTPQAPVLAVKLQ